MAPEPACAECLRGDALPRGTPPVTDQSAQADFVLSSGEFIRSGREAALTGSDPHRSPKLAPSPTNCVGEGVHPSPCRIAEIRLEPAVRAGGLRVVVAAKPRIHHSPRPRPPQGRHRAHDRKPRLGFETGLLDSTGTATRRQSAAAAASGAWRASRAGPSRANIAAITSSDTAPTEARNQPVSSSIPNAWKCTSASPAASSR